MHWKTSTRLKGLHTAVVCFCDNDVCSNFQIVWVSESFERPRQPEAVKQLYEIHWQYIEESNTGHWLCPDCAKVYTSERDTVELVAGGQVPTLDEALTEMVKQGEDTNSQ